MEIKDNNYVTLLGWMRTDLDLTGSELIIYALIYMVTQADRQDYYATQEYAAEWAGVSERSVRNNINSLIEKELVEKVTRCIDGKYITTYRVTDYHKPLREKTSGGRKRYETEKTSDNYKNDINKSYNIDSFSLRDNHSIESINSNRSITIESEHTNSKSTTKQDKISLKNKIIQLINSFTEDESLRKDLNEFVEHRKKAGKPVATEHAMDLLLRHLKDLSNGNLDTMKEMVDTSIRSGWLDFYPPKNQNTTRRERGIYESDEEDETPIPGLW